MGVPKQSLGTRGGEIWFPNSSLGTELIGKLSFPCTGVPKQSLGTRGGEMTEVVGRTEFGSEEASGLQEILADFSFSHYIHSQG